MQVNPSVVLGSAGLLVSGCVAAYSYSQDSKIGNLSTKVGQMESGIVQVLNKLQQEVNDLRAQIKKQNKAMDKIQKNKKVVRIKEEQYESDASENGSSEESEVENLVSSLIRNKQK